MPSLLQRLGDDVEVIPLAGLVNVLVLRLRLLSGSVFRTGELLLASSCVVIWDGSMPALCPYAIIFFPFWV